MLSVWAIPAFLYRKWNHSYITFCISLYTNPLKTIHRLLFYHKLKQVKLSWAILKLMVVRNVGACSECYSSGGAPSPGHTVWTLHWVKLSKVDKPITSAEGRTASAAVTWFDVSDFLSCYVKKAHPPRFSLCTDYMRRSRKLIKYL